MKVPYIRIRQRSEVFYCTKLAVSVLREKVHFHFRDPYLALQSSDKADKYREYIEKVKKKGIELTASDEGIQRRLQLNRIEDIRKFVESSTGNYFPNSILLCADVSKIEGFEEQYLAYEQSELGEFDFPDDIKFMVIDGQHRLAGLFLASETTTDEFELPAILLFNVSMSTAAKLFSEINGKQKPVSRSLIYDLYEEMDRSDIEEFKVLHGICQKFYTDEKSPLYRQIKMLGIGSGAISQAFFIDYARDSLKRSNLLAKGAQESYNQLFYYFKAFQTKFPNDWPVPLAFTSHADLDRYADNVLRKKRSQLAKTNGFGAILKIFPRAYQTAGGTYSGYTDLIEKLVGKIFWVPEQGQVQGTGKGFQTYLVRQMEEVLFGNLPPMLDSTSSSAP